MAEPEVKAAPQQAGFSPGKLAEFLKLNETTGEIITPENKRAVIITGDLWKALTRVVSQRLAAEFDDVLYSAGLAWGAQAYAEFNKGVSDSQKTLYHTRNMGLGDFKEQFNTYLTRHGWGRFDIYQKYELIFIDLFSSAFPKMVDQHDVMTCSLMAGFFSGFFTELIGVDLSCIELRCAAIGAEKCTFLVADSAITTSVRKWLTKGRAFDEIVEAIATKEYQTKR
jgi:predicted hydrocarbon binding protein